MDTKNFDESIAPLDRDNVTEEQDLGCIVGCALSDTLQEIISSLIGGYAILRYFEKKKMNPDFEKISNWKNRSEEIFALRQHYFCRESHKYDNLRRWIGMYSEELKRMDILRKQYDDITGTLST